MNFEILPTPPERAAYVRVNLTVLRDMLRLPSSVSIVAARSDDRGLILDLRGNLPADGELVANYDAIHATIPVFKGFEPAT